MKGRNDGIIDFIKTSKCSVKFYSENERYVVSQKKYFLGILIKEEKQHFDIFEDAQDKFMELKFDINFGRPS